jgi:hypothetical protein
MRGIKRLAAPLSVPAQQLDRHAVAVVPRVAFDVGPVGEALQQDRSGQCVIRPRNLGEAL